MNEQQQVQITRSDYAIEKVPDSIHGGITSLQHLSNKLGNSTESLRGGDYINKQNGGVYTLKSNPLEGLKQFFNGNIEIDNILVDSVYGFVLFVKKVDVIEPMPYYDFDSNKIYEKSLNNTLNLQTDTIVKPITSMIIKLSLIHDPTSEEIMYGMYIQPEILEVIAKPKIPKTATTLAVPAVRGVAPVHADLTPHYYEFLEGSPYNLPAMPSEEAKTWVFNLAPQERGAKKSVPGPDFLKEGYIQTLMSLQTTNDFDPVTPYIYYTNIIEQNIVKDDENFKALSNDRLDDQTEVMMKNEVTNECDILVKICNICFKNMKDAKNLFTRSDETDSEIMIHYKDIVASEHGPLTPDEKNKVKFTKNKIIYDLIKWVYKYSLPLNLLFLS